MKIKSFTRIAEDVYVIACIALLSGGLYLAFFAGSIRATDGTTDVVAQALRLPAYGYGLAILALHLKKMLGVARSAGMITIVSVACVVSVLWSIDTDLTLRRSILLLCTTLFGFALYVRYEREKLFRLLAITFIILAVSIFVSAIVAPNIAIHQDQHYPAIRGLFAHKNATSRMMLIGYVAGLALMSSPGQRKLGIAAAALSAGSVLATLSVSGLASIAFITTIFYFTKALRSFGRNFVVFSILLMIAVGIATSGLIYSTAVDAIYSSGRDLTLTGRTTIWSVLTETMLSHNPWLGFGYEAFWSSPEGAPSVAWGMDGFVPPHAHNGIMHAWAAIGVAGIFCITYLLTRYLFTNIRIIFLKPSTYSFAYLALFALIFLSNMTEVSLLMYGNIIWSLFVYSYMDLMRMRREA